MIIRDIVDMVNKEKRKSERVKTAKFAVGYAVGMVAVAAAGFTIGILFSPKSGKETREDIKKKAVNTVEAIADTLETIKHKVHGNEEIVKDSMVMAAKDVGNEIKDAKEKMKGVKEDI